MNNHEILLSSNFAIAVRAMEEFVDRIIRRGSMCMCTAIPIKGRECETSKFSTLARCQADLPLCHVVLELLLPSLQPDI